MTFSIKTHVSEMEIEALGVHLAEVARKDHLRSGEEIAFLGIDDLEHESNAVVAELVDQHNALKRIAP